MNKFNLDSPPTYPTDAQSVASIFPPVPVNTTPETVSRLIVLVSSGIDYSVATRRIWELANASGAHVQLLSLYKDSAQEPALRRKLVPMASLLQDGKVSADLKLELGTNWVELVKRNSQAGDMIICFAEQRSGLLHRPLSQILQSNLNTPIYILSDFPALNKPQSNWLSQIMAWSGSVGIIIGFFLLQIRIVGISEDWAQATLLILSVIAEAWLIGIWNSLFG